MNQHWFHFIICDSAVAAQCGIIIGSPSFGGKLVEFPPKDGDPIAATVDKMGLTSLK